MVNKILTQGFLVMHSETRADGSSPERTRRVQID